jgi:hypothetical protein
LASGSSHIRRQLLANSRSAWSGQGHLEDPASSASRGLRFDPTGNLKPAKDKSTERIDGIVAIIMAIGRAILVPGGAAAGIIPDAHPAIASSCAPPQSMHSCTRPLRICKPAAGADQGRAHLMTVFQDAVDATFGAFGIDAFYTPAGGEPGPVRVIARRPDTIVGFGDTRIHAETATFEVRASEVANPRPQDQLTVGGDTFVIQGEPERRDPDRLVWSLDTRPA